MNLSKRLEKFKGEPISLLCARYWYRGILSDVGEDYVVLSYPFAVEVTGSSQNPAAEREDALPSDLYLRIEFVEMVAWPTWCYNGLDKESLAKRKKDLEQAEADRKAGKKPVAPKVEPARR